MSKVKSTDGAHPYKTATPKLVHRFNVFTLGISPFQIVFWMIFQANHRRALISLANGRIQHFVRTDFDAFSVCQILQSSLPFHR